MPRISSPSAAQHRVNDLTLRVESPTGTVYWGNHGLWAALIVFYLVRGVTLAVRYPAIERAAIR